MNVVALDADRASAQPRPHHRVNRALTFVTRILAVFGVLSGGTVEGHRQLPGTCEHRRVVDRGFVVHGVLVDHGPPLDDAHGVAMKRPVLVKPRVV